MKKLFISIFLMLSMVVSGLSSLQFTPVASAINKSAVRCDFLGQYINPNSQGNKCEPCPVDFYCPLVAGTQIENCNSKGYPDSDCKESRKIFSTDKSIACPSGTTTKGFTFNTLSGTRITENGDAIFPIVGQGATDKSMCQKPDFVCSGATPVLLKGTDGIAKCYPANTCNDDQVPILKNGVPDCSVACKETIVNGKCYQNCPNGEYLEVTNISNNGVSTQSVICKKITIKSNECPILGQVLINNDIKTCACIAPQVLNETTKTCSLPIVPCEAPQVGNQPNCVNPPTQPCPANTYGYSQPNCRPCPLGGTSPVGTVDSSGCVIPVVAVVPCPANYYGVNGNVLCTPCPNNGTSPAGSKDVSGCKAQENGGGGFCSGFWAVLCGGAVVAGIDCFLTKIVCNKSQPTSPKITNTTPKISTTPGQIVKKDILAVYETAYSEQIDAQCVGGNSDLISTVYTNNPADAHNPDNGMFIWIATYSEGSITKSLSTIRPAGGMDGKSASASDLNSKAIDNNLQCLMQRYAKMPREGKPNGLVFGSSEYLQALKSDRILHGLNKKYKLECIDLIALGDALQIYGENSVEKKSSEFFVRNETKQTDYPQKFATQAEAEAYMNSLVVRVKARPKTIKTSTIFNFFTVINASAEADTDDTNPGDTSESLPDSYLVSANNPTSNSENKLTEISAFVCMYEDGTEAPDEECPETQDQTSEVDSQYSQYYNLNDCDQYAPYLYKGTCYELSQLKEQFLTEGVQTSTNTTNPTFTMYENDVCKNNYPDHPYYYTDKSGNVNCFSTESLTKQLAEDAAIDNGTTSANTSNDTTTPDSEGVCPESKPFNSYGVCKTWAEYYGGDSKNYNQEVPIPVAGETVGECKDPKPFNDYGICKSYSEYYNQENSNSNNEQQQVYDNGKTQSEIDVATQNCRDQGKDYDMYLDRCSGNTTQDIYQNSEDSQKV